MIKIAIIGHGFVGKAVDFAFTHPHLKKTIIDPIYDTHKECLEKDTYDIAFICVPTPTDTLTGKVDATIVNDYVDYILSKTATKIVAIKSTITPDVVSNLYKHKESDRLIYNPEFLTERSANEEFVMSEYHIVGGLKDTCNHLIQIYKDYSMCEAKEYINVTPQEASFIKYSVNSFLATKVIFFNQLYELCQTHNVSYNSVMKGIAMDKRIGASHTKVPGYDLKKGFGGACLPKDTLALLKFSNESMSILSTILDVNNTIRKDYALDEREKANKITFNQN